MSFARTLFLAVLALLPRSVVAADVGAVVDHDLVGEIAVDDRCPEWPETYNGFQDEDGCPDEVLCTLGRPSMGMVYFANGDADVKARSLPVLARNGAVLTEFPEVRIEIIGHAHAREGRTPDDRIKLARRRAEAVQAVLIHVHGVDSSRLTIRAAGDGEPIDTNKTAPGRRKNSRVEFSWLAAK